MAAVPKPVGQPPRLYVLPDPPRRRPSAVASVAASTELSAAERRQMTWIFLVLGYCILRTLF